jgi:hypothetical protein
VNTVNKYIPQAAKYAASQNISAMKSRAYLANVSTNQRAGDNPPMTCLQAEEQFSGLEIG